MGGILDDEHEALQGYDVLNGQYSTSSHSISPLAGAQTAGISAAAPAVAPATATATAAAAPTHPYDTLISYGWTSGPGGVVNLSYNFLTSVPSYYSATGPERNKFSEFTDPMKDAVRDILGSISKFTNINFTEAPTNSSAVMRFGRAEKDGIAGWGYYPAGSVAVGAGDASGDVWINPNTWDTYQKGALGYQLLLHEIGHALGLNHAFEGPNPLTGQENNKRYTVMAYDWDLITESYMLYDVAALQEMYGVRNTATGNDIYTLTNWPRASTIWDGGGIDTLDASSMTSAVTLKLGEGEYSSVSADRNLAIAYGTVIENANGGSGNDTIYDNAANNVINCNGGDDKVYCGAGNDTINGGAGVDTLYYAYARSGFTINQIDAATLKLSQAQIGVDLISNIEKFSFAGVMYTLSQMLAAAVPDDGSGGGGGGGGGGGNTPAVGVDIAWQNQVYNADSIAQGQADISGSDLGKPKVTDTLFTFDRVDDDHLIVAVLSAKGPKNLTFTAPDEGIDISFAGISTKLNVTLDGGQGDDTVTLSTLMSGSKVLLHGDGGNDNLSGSAGNDKIYGDAGNDILLGLGGNDDLRGGAGNDIIVGGAGNDRIEGGIGNDILDGGLGNDTILVNGGNDTVVFSVLDKKIDTVQGFSVTGADASKIDVSDVLSGYDPLADSLSDFVRITASGKSNANLFVNSDGVGNDWVKVAVFTDTDLGKVTVDTLHASGQLIA